MTWLRAVLTHHSGGKKSPKCRHCEKKFKQYEKVISKKSNRYCVKCALYVKQIDEDELKTLLENFKLGLYRKYTPENAEKIIRRCPLVV